MQMLHSGIDEMDIVRPQQMPIFTFNKQRRSLRKG